MMVLDLILGLKFILGVANIHGHIQILAIPLIHGNIIIEGCSVGRNTLTDHPPLILLAQACRASLHWAEAMYSGLVANMRPFISLTALVASSGEEKPIKLKPIERLPSIISCGRGREWREGDRERDNVIVTESEMSLGFKKIVCQKQLRKCQRALSICLFPYNNIT